MSGVAGLQQGITSINRLKRAIRELPLNIQTAVADEAAGYLDIEVRADFDAGRTVYDTPRPLGANGNKLTLIGPSRFPRTKRRWKKGRKYPPHKGHVRDELGFTAVGTIVRAVLTKRHARYLVGKYKILPARLPVAWQQYLDNLVREYREDWEREQAR